MLHCKCQRCNSTVPLNESFSVGTQQVCGRCAEEVIAEAGGRSKIAATQNNDPTICTYCGRDGGNSEYPLLASLPVCTECAAFFRNRPFPIWIKMATIGLAALVVFALAWNWRFYKAHTELNQAATEMGSGHLSAADSLTASALMHVPESQQVQALADYTAGVRLLQEDRFEDALTRLFACVAYFPPEWGVEEMIFQARLGSAFDGEDYDSFLQIAQELYLMDSLSAMPLATMASAYACKYAETGSEEYRLQSEFYLSRSRNALGAEELGDYDVRIRHRLHTGEIISREEFLVRYPDGWQPTEEY